MASRYYLNVVNTSGTYQLPSTPSSTDVWTNSGSTPAGQLDLSTVANQIYQYTYSTTAMQPPASGTYFSNWWATLPFNITSSLVVPATKCSIYFAQSDWSNTADRGHLFPRFNVYQWRPGTGVIQRILSPTTGHVPGDASGSHFFVLSSSFSIGSFTLQPSDRIIFELWMSSSFTGVAVGGLLTYAYTWYGTTPDLADGVDESATVQNGVTSWIEFDATLPSFFTGSGATPSTDYVSTGRIHTDSNKLKLVYGSPVATGSIVYTAFSITSASNGIVPTVTNAAIVPSTNNQEIDLSFGTDLTYDANQTHALWKLNDPVGGIADVGGNFPLGDTNTTYRADGLLYASRQFPGSINTFCASGFTTGSAAVLYGDHMIDAVVRPTGTWSGNGVVVIYGGTGSTQFDNTTTQLYLGSNLNINVSWQYSGSTTLTLSTTRTLTRDVASIITMRKKASTTFSGYYDVDLFVNGEKWNTWYKNVPPTNGTGSSVAWTIGRARSAINPFTGFIGTVRITSGTYTDNQIVAYHTGYIYPLTRGATYQLSSSIVNDAQGLQIFPPSSSFVMTYIGVNPPQNSTFMTGTAGSTATRTTYTMVGSVAPILSASSGAGAGHKLGSKMNVGFN